MLAVPPVADCSSSVAALHVTFPPSAAETNSPMRSNNSAGFRQEGVRVSGGKISILAITIPLFRPHVDDEFIELDLDAFFVFLDNHCCLSY